MDANTTAEPSITPPDVQIPPRGGSTHSRWYSTPRQRSRPRSSKSVNYITHNTYNIYPPSSGAEKQFAQAAARSLDDNEGNVPSSADVRKDPDILGGAEASGELARSKSAPLDQVSQPQTVDEKATTSARASNPKAPRVSTDQQGEESLDITEFEVVERPPPSPSREAPSPIVPREGLWARERQLETRTDPSNPDGQFAPSEPASMKAQQPGPSCLDVFAPRCLRALLRRLAR